MEIETTVDRLLEMMIEQFGEEYTLLEVIQALPDDTALKALEYVADCGELEGLEDFKKREGME